MSELAQSIATSTPRKRRTCRTLALIVLAILILIFLHWLLFQGNEIVPHVIVRPLWRCDVIWYGNWGGALVLACPRMDMLKFWPLPVQQPWYEDSFEPPVTASGENHENRLARAGKVTARSIGQTG
jgi:hypothetical protein